MPIHDWTRVDAGVFHHLHTTWIPDIMRALIGGLLPPGYYAMVEQVASGTVPDVLTLQRQNTNGQNDHGAQKPPSGSGVVALAEAPPRVMHRTVSPRDPYAARARSIVVRHSGNDRVVAIIEIVSPGNKNSRQALQSFVEKAVACLRAGVHLLVIDLFPPGSYDPEGIHRAIWSQFDEDDFVPPHSQPLTLASYVGGATKEAFVQPMGVGERIPDASLFLTPGEYVNVPLEDSYMGAYATVPLHWQKVLESR